MAFRMIRLLITKYNGPLLPIKTDREIGIWPKLNLNGSGKKCRRLIHIAQRSWKYARTKKGTMIHFGERIA